MSWIRDYREASLIRDKVVDAVIPSEDKNEITQVLWGVELGLIASVDKMVVSREGAAMLEMYVRYLERKIYTLMSLQRVETKEIQYVTSTCPNCDGYKYVLDMDIKVKKNRAVPCKTCKGKGFVYEPANQEKVE